MAYDTEIAVAVANSMVEEISAALDVGTGAIIDIFTGAQPATCETADSGTLLGTLLCSATSFGAASGGVITAAAITSETNAPAGGTAAHFRAYPTATSQIEANKGACLVQGTVGTSGTDMILDNTTIVTAGTIACTAWTITMPTS